MPHTPVDSTAGLCCAVLCCAVLGTCFFSATCRPVVLTAKRPARPPDCLFAMQAAGWHGEQLPVSTTTPLIQTRNTHERSACQGTFTNLSQLCEYTCKVSKKQERSLQLLPSAATFSYVPGSLEAMSTTVKAYRRATRGCAPVTACPACVERRAG